MTSDGAESRARPEPVAGAASAATTVAARLRLRRMRLDDIPAVLAVERAAYNEGWPPTAFDQELRENAMARYLVLEADEGGASRVVGFAGAWLMVDQAHVVTVAVEPAARGRGYGRLLVHALVALAAREGMSDATLEVRVSNAAARALYRAYGFHEVGHRRAYYPDNGEDAVIMTTEELSGARYRRRLASLREAVDAVLPGGLAAVEDAERLLARDANEDGPASE